MPWPNTLGSPAAWALTSSWCMGLKSPEAPAYITRSVRVSSWLIDGPSSPSLTSSKYRSAMEADSSSLTRASHVGGAAGPVGVPEPAFQHLAVRVARQRVDQLPLPRH